MNKCRSGLHNNLVASWLYGARACNQHTHMLAFSFGKKVEEKPGLSTCGVPIIGTHKTIKIIT
jgi:hypothetical protein